MSFLAKFNNDGSLNETSGSNIFQYSSGANVIEMQIDKPQNSVVTISLVKADGTKLSAKPCVAKIGSINAWVYTFDNTDLSVDGDLDISFTISYNGVDLNTETITGTVQTSYNNGYVAVDPTMTEEILQWLSNLQVDKVGRYDIENLPVDIIYNANGLKSANNLFLNAQFTINGTLTPGTLLVTATGTSTITQQELFLVGTEIWRRTLTITGGTVTVGDWKDYSTEITEAISTHNISGTAHQDIRTAINNETIARENADTILQENIDAIETARVISVNGRTGNVTLTKSDVGLGNVSNIKVSLNAVYPLIYISGIDYSVTVPDDITVQDFSDYGIFVKITNNMIQNQSNTVRVTIKNENGSTLFNKKTINFRYFNGNLITAITATNYLRIGTLLRIWSTSDGVQLYETNRDLSEEASVSMPGLLTSENLGKINNAILKTTQTLTNTEKSQVRTNIDVYSKSEVDNKVSSVYKFKGSVATYGDLPTENLTIGDVYNVLNSGKNFAWTGTTWDDLGGTVDLSNYLAKNNTTIFTPTGDYNPSTKKYVDDGLALKEQLLPTTPTDPESKFLNGNKVWTPIVIGGGSSAAAIYLTDDTSTTVGTYKQLSYALPSTETTISSIVTSGTSPLLVQTYIYDTDYANTIIDAGKWTFNFTALLSTTAGTTHLRVEVFTRTSGGTETTLFTVDGADINSTTAVKYAIETLQSGFVVNTTDRLGMRVYAITTQAGNTTVTYYKGDGRGAYVNTPLALRHSQLRDINGDANYQHITQTQKTKLDNLNAPLIFNNITVLTTDFTDNLTYSEFPYRASITLNGVLSTDSPKVYFSMADINTAVLTETIYQVVSYSGGIHIYATDLPTSNLTIDKIEIIR